MFKLTEDLVKAVVNCHSIPPSQLLSLAAEHLADILRNTLYLTFFEMFCSATIIQTFNHLTASFTKKSIFEVVFIHSEVCHLN